MRYYRVIEKFGTAHLCVEAKSSVLTSLTSINDLVCEYRDLLDASYITGVSVDAIAERLLNQSAGKEFDLIELIEWSRSGKGDARIIKPLEPDEMWAGGFGNMILTPEKLAESDEGSRRAYNTPEISTTIYKGTNHRLVGPFDAVGIRSDTPKTISEGEVVFVIYKGKLAGYSTGNEVAGNLASLSSHWTVPSKVFTGCASIGPCIATPESIDNPMSLNLELVHQRGDDIVGQISTKAIFKRTPEDIVASTVAHDSPPDLVIQYSGGFAAVADAAMHAGDVVRITMEGVGFVENTVETV